LESVCSIDIKILVVCGLLRGEKNLSIGCHGDSKSANFFASAFTRNKQGTFPVCFPTGEAGNNNAETGYMRWSPICHHSKQWVAKGEVLIYIVKVNFSNIVAFEGTIRKYLNMVTVHIGDPMHHPICLFDILFSFQCPFKGNKLQTEQAQKLSQL
jgi:hypothetical protein